MKTCRHCGKHAGHCEKTRALWLALDEQAELDEQLAVYRSGIAA